jgi:hypothetical protein
MTALKKLKEWHFLSRRRLEAVVFLTLFLSFFGFIGHVMGVGNMLNTLMKTSHDLLVNTVFFIMGITVLSGALSRLLIEFGVVRLLEVVMAPLMRPLYNLPGVASLAGLMSFFSDNPAIISLSTDKNFSRYFRTYELISVTNFGTSFGMGMVVIAFMTGLGYFSGAIIGVVGALFGGILATRLMQWLIKDKIPADTDFVPSGNEQNISFRSSGSYFDRFLNALLDGGKSGVQLGLAIIPGVLVISSIIMIITFKAADPAVGYQGIAYEGVPILPYLAGKLSWLFEVLYGFKQPELIAFPVTSLGAVGAALSLVKAFIAQGIIGINEIAVFSAMGMCWSGFLSTHTAILDALKFRSLTPLSLISQTVGGLFAGVVAHYIVVALTFMGFIG